MSPKRNLQTLFSRARQESSPVSSDDVRSIVEAAGSAPSMSNHMPAIITSTVATLAMAAGLTAYLLSPDPSTVQSTFGAVAEPKPTSREMAVADPTGNDANVSIAVLSLESGDLQSLNIDLASLGVLRNLVPHADSIAQCMPRAKTSNGTLCVWKNGERKEVALCSAPGPMPVMFTSSDGRGKMVRIEMSEQFDPNELIPVEAPSPNGNMLMWFSPTKDLMSMLPEGVEKQLCKERGIGMDVDVRIIRDGKDGQFAMPNIDSLMRTLPSFDSLVDGRSRIIMKRRNIVINSDNPKITIIDTDTLNKTTIDTDSLDKTIFDIDYLIKTQICKLPNAIIATSNDTVFIDTNAAPCARMSMKTRVIILRRGNKSSDIVPTVDGSKLQENRIESGALRLENIYPNPTMDGGAAVSYTLSGDRLINVDLHDLSGNKVATLVSGVRKSTGTGQIAFTLDGITPGMYLVTMTTDRGERAVQRLIVQ